jgi:hypothetical protein
MLVTNTAGRLLEELISWSLPEGGACLRIVVHAIEFSANLQRRNKNGVNRSKCECH